MLALIDKGLSSGLGEPKPGEMCIEAVVCHAMGLPHGDNPPCVAPMLRSLKIRLNDAKWSSKVARSRGMRRLGLVQLGSKDHLDEGEFRKRLVDYALRVSTPTALRSAASVQKDGKRKEALYAAANRCEKEGTRQAALDARDVARAYADADAAAKNSARDKSLADYAEAVVQILIDLKVPGVQWLELTEE